MIYLHVSTHRSETADHGHAINGATQTLKNLTDIRSDFSKDTVLLTWFVVYVTLRVTPRLGTPEGGRQTSLAERVETGQQFGFSVVKAQLTNGTSVHKSEDALLFQPVLSCW